MAGYQSLPPLRLFFYQTIKSSTCCACMRPLLSSIITFRLIRSSNPPPQRTPQVSFSLRCYFAYSLISSIHSRSNGSFNLRARPNRGGTRMYSTPDNYFRLHIRDTFSCIRNSLPAYQQRGVHNRVGINSITSSRILTLVFMTLPPPPSTLFQPPRSRKTIAMNLHIHRAFIQAFKH